MINQRHQTARRVKALLAKRWPLTFAVPRPLKRGIHHDLAAAALDLSKQQIKIGLTAYAGQPAYLQSLRPGAMRVDLDGQEAGAVTEEEAAQAVERLKELKARQKQKRIQSSTKPSSTKPSSPPSSSSSKPSSPPPSSPKAPPNPGRLGAAVAGAEGGGAATGAVMTVVVTVRLKAVGAKMEMSAAPGDEPEAADTFLANVEEKNSMTQNQDRRVPPCMPIIVHRPGRRTPF
jgi:ProP effector